MTIVGRRGEKAREAAAEIEASGGRGIGLASKQAIADLALYGR